MSEELFNKLAQSVIDGEPEDAEELAKQALDQGVDVDRFHLFQVLALL